MSKELEQRVLEQTRELAAANEALRLSEAQFRGAFDHAPIGMALLRPDGRWLTANPAFCRMLGYAKPELLEEPFQSILHPEDLEAHLKGARQLLAGQINLFAVEERLFHKDGRIIWTHASVTVVRAAEGDPLYFVAQIQDISGSKRIQEALRESEERFRQLAENIAEVFWMTNPDKNEILYVSPGYEKIWGWPRRSLCERPSEWLDAIHPDDRERIQNSAMTLQASGAYDEEYRIIRPDGSTRWVRDRAFPIKDTSGRVYRITGIAEDITERRQAEERIRFQARLLDVVEQAVIATDIAGVILYWNRFAEKLYGWSAGEVLGRNIMEITPSDLSLDQAGEIMNLLARGEGWSGEFLVRRRDGASFMAMVIDTPIRDDQGKLIGIIGVSFDVSERKRESEALEESEERLRMAINASRMYTWDWDVQTGRVIRSGHYAPVYGSDLPVSNSDYLSFLHLVHPEDRERVKQAGDRLLEKKEATYHFEFRIVRTDGDTRWLETQGLPFYDGTGAVVRVMGVTQDITERKRAEIERDHHAAQLQGLADASLAVNSAMSLDETLKMVTDKTREIIGAHMSVTGMTINGRWEQAISVVSFSDKYEAFRHYDERPDGSGIYAMVCQANRPLRMTQAELEAHPRWHGYGKHAGAHPPLRGWLAAPLVGRDGKNIGLIQLSDKYEGEFTQQDEAILVQMAQLASNAIENARLYETLEKDIQNRKRTEERLREYEKAVEGLEEMIIVVDRDYRYLIANRAFLNYRGMEKEQLIGRFAPDLLGREVFEKIVKKKLDACFRGEVVKYEMKFSYPKLGERVLSLSYFPIEGPAGIDRVACVMQDITERKQADEALRQSEEKYRTLFETMAQGVVYHDSEGMILSANPAAESILGLTLDQLQGRTPFDPRWRAIREDGSDYPGKNHPAMVALRTGEAVREAVMRVFHPKTETYRWISINAVPQFRAGEDKPYQVYTAFSDITERKKAEETIRAAKEFSENLIQTANVMILSLDTEGRIDIFNKAAEKITGYTLSELKGKNWFETLVPRDRYPSVWEYFTQLVAGGTPKTFENPILTKTGEERYILWQNNQVKVDGNVIATISFGNDITEQKQAEEALRAEYAFRKAIEEAMPAGVMVVDSTGRQTYVNQSFCEMVGWSAEELNGAAPPFIFWPPEQIDRIKESFERHTRGRIKAGPVELIFRRRNEERFPVSLLVSSLVDHQGEPVGYLASVHDMSVLKTSQEKLERRERQLLQAQRLAHLGSWSWDLVSDTVTWSDELYPIFGVDPERFTPTYQGVVHLIHPDDREKFKQANRTALRGGRSFEVSFRVIRSEGAVRILHASGMVSLDPTGRPVSIVGVVQDITDIKQAEETLRESEERYRSLIANIPDAAWRVREDGQPIFISRNIEKIIGYTSEEICSGGFTLTFGRIHPEDRERVARAFKSLFSKNQKFDVEYRVQRKNGEWIWIHDRAVMTYQREGIRYADGIVSDITERKKSEEAVRKSEERFHLIARATNDAVWDWDLPTNTVWWNESFKTLFGYNEIEPGVESWSKRIHPEDKERVLAGTHAVVERGEQFWSAEYRFLRADGSYATILDRGYVVHVKDGKATRMIGAMMDITERKRAEEALADYAKRLQNLSGQLLEAQEAERRQIARELHDEIGQSLTAIKIQLHGAKRRSDRGMEECIDMVDQALSQVRNLSLDLHPPQLDELGLVATLRWHLDRQTHAANLVSNFSADPLPTRLPQDIEIASFRIAQEALTNVVRHAYAGEVSIELRQRGNELHLTIEDDGEGFDVGAARDRAIQGASLGLVGMQERAELAGGRLELNSIPGEGTRVHAVFPLVNSAPRKQSKRRKI